MLESNELQSIMIVEDSDDDFEATVRALTLNKNLLNPVLRCRDGKEAWIYLKGQTQEGSSGKFPRPGLILLDLNMPGLDGRQLLGRIKADEELRRIPVAIMTTSAEPEDVEACYRAGANAYVLKPISWPKFAIAIARLHEFWFQIALLPK